MSAAAGTVVTSQPGALVTQQNFPQGFYNVFLKVGTMIARLKKKKKKVSAEMSAGLDIFRLVERKEEP